MSVVLTDLRLPSGQEPVGLNPVELELDLLFDSSIDASTTGVVAFWCTGPFTVVPPRQTVTMAAGQATNTQRCTVRLDGAAPTSPTMVRVYAECDERHSVFVKVA